MPSRRQALAIERECPRCSFCAVIAEASHLRANRVSSSRPTRSRGIQPLIAQMLARGCGRGWERRRASVPSFRSIRFAWKLQPTFTTAAVLEKLELSLFRPAVEGIVRVDLRHQRSKIWRKPWSLQPTSVRP